MAGRWAIAASRAGAGDVVRVAAVGMGSGGMATQGGQWAVAATRAGAGGVVRGAIESMMPGELSAKGGAWAIAAVTNGAHRDLYAAITQMGDGELEKKSEKWKQAAACVGFRTPDPVLRLIGALASGGGTESGPIVGAAPQVMEQLFMCMYGCDRAFTTLKSRRSHGGRCPCKRTK
jgi:hypothetical protein